jgi:hypothetical protein
MKKLKAQASMIEHILMVFFIVVIIIALMIFLTNFQFSQMEMEKKKTWSERSLALGKKFMNSQFTAKKESMLEDAKLASLLGFTCQELENIFGAGWFMEVKIFDSSGMVIPCRSPDSFSACNYWSLSSCSAAGGKNVSYIFPVNIYRKMFERSDIGTIKTGVYIS